GNASAGRTGLHVDRTSWASAAGFSGLLMLRAPGRGRRLYFAWRMAGNAGCFAAFFLPADSPESISHSRSTDYGFTRRYRCFFLLKSRPRPKTTAKHFHFGVSRYGPDS